MAHEDLKVNGLPSQGLGEGLIYLIRRNLRGFPGLRIGPGLLYLLCLWYQNSDLSSPSDSRTWRSPDPQASK